MLRFCRYYRHIRFAIIFFSKANLTIYQGKNGMVLSETYVFTWMMLGTSLSDDDVSGDNGLSAEFLYTKTFTLRFSSVFGTTDTFFVSHD